MQVEASQCTFVWMLAVTRGKTRQAPPSTLEILVFNWEAMLSALRHVPQTCAVQLYHLNLTSCPAQAVNTEVRDPRGASLGTKTLLFQPARRDLCYYSLSETAKCG